MENAIVGRIAEIDKLKTYIHSDRSEFVAIYGRRRVGKTFLIKELFEGEFAFRLTGRENASMKDQLVNFSYAMSDYFGETDIPENWTEAFRMLSKSVEKMGEGAKLIFIDEMPWLDTPKSKFISALEYFWNEWAYFRKDVKLIVCGSATSWMLNKLINARGGLHNRVTHKMLISPFTLKESESYFLHNGFCYERPEILECYMAVGGVAYYLSLFDSKKSVAENIGELCFSKGGELTDEFEKLYSSLFKRATSHLEIIKALSSTCKGLSRSEIIEKTKLLNNGNLTIMLSELEVCEFIRSYVPFGKEKKDKLYQLIDPFSLFHLRFINNNRFSKDFWLHTIGTNAYQIWCGYAFETVCLHHIDQIVEGLGIGGIINTPCSWLYKPSVAVLENIDADDDLKTGAQIDLLIDRTDKTVSICEMKYSDAEYQIDKAYDKRVQDRLRTFKKVTRTPKSLQLVYVTPHGLYNNMYSRNVRKQLTIEDLFR